MTRIAIIGNTVQPMLDRGGNTTLARRLGASLCLPVYQVDLVQWLPGWVRAPADAIAAAHEQWLAQPAWIIDGWGSWPVLAERFERSETIILVDFPLVTHYWWAIKRRTLSVLRPGGDWPPPGCAALPVTGRLLRLDLAWAKSWQVHTQMRPPLLEMIDSFRGRRQVVTLHAPAELRRFMEDMTDGNQRPQRR